MKIKLILEKKQLRKFQVTSVIVINAVETRAKNHKNQLNMLPSPNLHIKKLAPNQ